MTLADVRTRPCREPWHPRSEIEVAAQQLLAIDRFNTARQTAAQAAAAAGRSRELRMDASRQLEVVRRQHEALISRAHEQLRVSGALLHGTAARRAVLAHRSEWFLDKLAHQLQDAGIGVVARVDNGADAIGLAVAEQPDLLLVEDTLAMVSGEQVVREVRQYSPDTVIAAQVDHGGRVDPFLDAGAASVFTRRVPPGEIATELRALLSA